MVMEDVDINHQLMEVEIFSPRGKATPFLKLTFLTQSDRRDATKNINAIKASTGYTISPVEPREVQSWLPQHKKQARNNIVCCLQEKGYKVTDSDISVMLKWKYNPFHFIWNVRCEIYSLNIDILDEKPFLDQISDTHLLN